MGLMGTGLKWLGYLMLIVAIFLLPQPGQAVDYHWIAGNGVWKVDTNWNPVGEPGEGDKAYVTQSTASDLTVTYNSDFPDEKLSELHVNAAGGGTMILAHTSVNEALRAGAEFVGFYGKGTVNHSIGQNLTDVLVLGQFPGSLGTYNLSGSGYLNTSTEAYIGDQGTGVLNQQTGTTYEATGPIYVGYSNGAQGTYNHNGGSVSAIDGLYLGYQSGSQGTYIRGTSGSLSTLAVYVGYAGTGQLTQEGGTSYIWTNLSLGELASGNGTYELSGGNLIVDSNVLVGNQGGGTFTQDGGTSTLTLDLYLGENTDSSGTYELSRNGSLSARNQFIGASGDGVFTQENGSNTLTGKLSVAANPGSSGAYSLQDGSLSAGNEEIGNKGNGALTQSGGTNTIANQLILGEDPAGSGAYDLNGGSLTAFQEIIGEGGTGAFTQSGGTNTVTHEFYLGMNSGSSGTYELTGDGSLSAYLQYIGSGGAGVFTQNNGSNTVTGTLTIAAFPGSSGAYYLQGGSLTVGGIVLNSGGIFRKTGGNLHYTAFNQLGGEVQGSLENEGVFNYTSGVFNGRLLNYGTANFDADFIAGNGMAHYTTLAIPTGRTLTLNGDGLDNNGDITLAGGTLTGTGPLVNNTYLNGYGTISGLGGFINQGIVTQSGGTLTLNNSGVNINYGNLDLESGRLLRLGSSASLSNLGALNLNGAIITGDGILNNGYMGAIYGRGTISSYFNNSGGLLVVADGATNITNAFNNNGIIQLTDYTAFLNGGAIANSGTIEGRGHVGNQVTNTGTIEAISGTLTLGGEVTNIADGLMTAGPGSKLLVSSGLNVNNGVINLTGGTFDNGGQSLTNNNQISGYGTFRTGGLTNQGSITLTGGNTTVNGNLTNDADLEIRFDPAIFTGDVENQPHGTIKVTQTTVTWAGSFTNDGTYISDPSTNKFADLIIGATGTLIGDPGDDFEISGNFENRSALNELWNTWQCDLAFTNGAAAEHALYLPGEDRGATMDGYDHNFAWGTLTIDGQTVRLFDGNDTNGGALYVGEILGADRDLKALTVANILGADGLNIYYNPFLDGNDYLEGQTYTLNEAGTSLLMPTPIPASVLLLGSGLLGLGLLGWRRRGT